MPGKRNWVRQEGAYTWSTENFHGGQASLYVKSGLWIVRISLFGRDVTVKGVSDTNHRAKRRASIVLNHLSRELPEKIEDLILNIIEEGPDGYV